MKNWIKVERAKRGITQKELGKALGVSQHAIAAIETERYEANVGFALDAAKFFNKKVEDLFFRTEADVPENLGSYSSKKIKKS